MAVVAAVAVVAAAAAAAIVVVVDCVMSKQHISVSQGRVCELKLRSNLVSHPFSVY